ncbi:hypothetical protein THIOSC13_130006 [uncultured Thiomicrorhabdus sp.]
MSLPLLGISLQPNSNSPPLDQLDQGAVSLQSGLFWMSAPN